jgi:hypothetical protein
MFFLRSGSLDRLLVSCLILDAVVWIANSYPPYSDKALRIVSWLAIGKMPYAKPAVLALVAAAVYFAAKKYKVL